MKKIIYLSFLIFLIWLIPIGSVFGSDFNGTAIEQFRTSDLLRVFIGQSFPDQSVIGFSQQAPINSGEKFIITSTTNNYILTKIVFPAAFLLIVLFIVIWRFKDMATGKTSEMIIIPFLLITFNGLAAVGLIDQWWLIIEIVFLGGGVSFMIMKVFARGPEQ